MVRTWAPRGKTPTLRHTFNWSKLSVVGAVTEDGCVYQNTYEHAIRGPHFVAFLEHLLRHIDGPIVLVVDRSPIHRARVVKAFLERNPRLWLELLPAYAPECNPTEWLWAHVKRRSLGNLCARTPAELRGAWRRALARVRLRPELVRSFFAASAIRAIT